MARVFAQMRHIFCGDAAKYPFKRFFFFFFFFWYVHFTLSKLFEQCLDFFIHYSSKLFHSVNSAHNLIIIIFSPHLAMYEPSIYLFVHLLFSFFLSIHQQSLIYYPCHSFSYANSLSPPCWSQMSRVGLYFVVQRQGRCIFSVNFISFFLVVTIII